MGSPPSFCCGRRPAGGATCDRGGPVRRACHISSRCSVLGRRGGTARRSRGGLEVQMKIVVVGGRGLVGSKVVAILRGEGHEVVAASRRTGVDAVSGVGLAEALKGAAVLVDASNPAFREDAAVMTF